MQAEDTSSTKMKSTSSSRACSPSPQGETPAGASLQVPSEPPASTSSKRETRATSPTSIPSVLLLKAQSQSFRFETLKSFQQEIPTEAQTTSLNEVRSLLESIDEIHQAFLREHANFEETWPARFINHEYFTSQLMVQEAKLVASLNRSLRRLVDALGTTSQGASNAVKGSSARSSKLPELALPTFSGSYIQWPEFSELFTSLIINDRQLMEIDRLHYLRNSLSGEPAEHVASYPVTGSSFQACWEYLNERFSNKRVLIQEQLNKLLNSPPITSRTSKSLNELMSSFVKMQKSLMSLGAAEDMFNCLLIHQATTCLDKNTREAWEMEVGSSTEFPRFERLVAFVNTKAGALERLESAAQASSSKKTLPSNTAASSRSTQRKSAANTATQAQPPKRQGSGPKSTTLKPTYPYPCDCCQENHFVVSCPKFRDKSVEERRRFITTYTLCRNCCGRHPTDDCKSAHRCKTCGAKHHTMLHLNTQPSQPQAKTTSTAPPPKVQPAPRTEAEPAEEQQF